MKKFYLVVALLLSVVFSLFSPTSEAEAAACRNLDISLYSQNTANGEVILRIEGTPGNEIQLAIGKHMMEVQFM
ncbi:hypothetical protein [Halobacillus hunanensis]|uniref:hypothetical protein n=1 Tax=Halobacillus hunanensis TaxID=578214 RepID=UPI0009A8AF31|nr:hypothetical protein [Halobacillus hunanensis]